MALPLTAIYAGILGLIGCALASGSGLLRVKTGISLGPGDDKQQLLAFRRHGNFAEGVPLTVVMIAILELNGVSPTAIHVLGGALVLGRIAHPLGLNPDNIQGIGRAIGAGLTFLVTVVASIWAIWTGVS